MMKLGYEICNENKKPIANNMTEYCNSNNSDPYDKLALEELLYI